MLQIFCFEKVSERVLDANIYSAGRAKGLYLTKVAYSSVTKMEKHNSGKKKNIYIYLSRWHGLVGMDPCHYAGQPDFDSKTCPWVLPLDSLDALTGKTNSSFLKFLLGWMFYHHNGKQTRKEGERKGEGGSRRKDRALGCCQICDILQRKLSLWNSSLCTIMYTKTFTRV